MLKTLAINNYRSLLKLVVPLGNLNLITGANGSGKSNFYRALRLLSETAQGGVISALAREGGLDSTFWAGPETISRQMRSGEVPIQGGPRKKPKRLQLGFAGEDFGYTIALGLPPPGNSYFDFDPEIKRESIWSGDYYRSAGALIDRKGCCIKYRVGRRWEVLPIDAPTHESMFSQIADPKLTPEIFSMREHIQNWRFYDHFRTDSEAPARIPQLGTRTMKLHHDGRDLAAALQTIIEIGDGASLNQAVSDAFPSARVEVNLQSAGRFSLIFHQHGLLRPLSGAELSDGTLRYLLWVAALHTPRPPTLMVLNEPETSLHPDLLPALARLIISASERTQVWVVSHSPILVDALKAHPDCNPIELDKESGQTVVKDQGMMETPLWHWPK